MTAYTPRDIKRIYEQKGEELKEPRYFFSPSTMKFFGDSIGSYGVREIEGTVYLYRKRDAYVNVFGRTTRAGREFFNAWRFNPDTGALDNLPKEHEQVLFEAIYPGRGRPRGIGRALNSEYAPWNKERSS